MLLRLLFSLTVGLLSGATGLARQPNVILILADDLGYETVGCYGGTSYPTPNIDRLASEGIRFSNAFALPLCTNTRIQLMTGTYNIHNWDAFGILDPDETTFGHRMQQAGYATCIAGKWQLQSYDPPDYPGAELRRDTGMHPADAGFDAWSLWHTGHTEDKGSRYADPVIIENGKRRENTAGSYGPDEWVAFIERFIETHREEPFFVYYPMALPHNPMVPTPDSPEWQDPALRSVEETRFAADMIRYTDKLVGKLVGVVDRLGLGEETLILFYSDNGTNNRVVSRMGEVIVRGGKSEGTDLGIRVPLIARWTGVTPPGTVEDDLIDSVDFFPTLLDVGGNHERIEEDIDGVSFAPQLRGDKGNPRDAIFIHHDPRPGWDKDRFHLIRLARDKRYKLHQDGRLFDLQKDPFEREPIFLREDAPVERERRAKLQQVLDALDEYERFEPAEVPRANPAAPVADYAWHDQGGFIVAEAELLPTPRDESWRRETNVPNYTGTGYLRALRSQSAPPERGATRIFVHPNNGGRWRVALRGRTDHVEGEENSVWVRLNEGPWRIARLDPARKPGRWHWIEQWESEAGSSRPARFELEEKHNALWIAPRSGNFKIDRIVLYQVDRRTDALQPTTPLSPFHPWASP